MLAKHAGASSLEKLHNEHHLVRVSRQPPADSPSSHLHFRHKASAENKRWAEARSPHSPSLLLSLAKLGAWLLDSWEELLKDDGGRLASSAPSHSSVNNHKAGSPSVPSPRQHIYIQHRRERSDVHRDKRQSWSKFCFSAKPTQTRRLERKG